jgi:hypothetical protein
MGFGDVSVEKNTFKFKVRNNTKIPEAEREQMLTIFDTGTSFTMVPKSHWDAYTKEIISKFDIKNAQVVNGFFSFSCIEQSKIGKLSFMFGGVWLEMDPRDFVFDASEAQDGSVCALAIVQNELEFFILGNSFMRGYYTIHEPSAGRIGFAPNTASAKPNPVSAPIPS